MPKTSKVLIAEDEKVLSKILTNKLKRQGLEVIQAFDGQEAVDLAKKHQPKLMLIDLIMPNKDGFEVLSELQKLGLTKKIYIIVASNLGQDADKVKAKKLGAKDYIIKSNTPVEEIVKIITTKIK